MGFKCVHFFIAGNILYLHQQQGMFNLSLKSFTMALNAYLRLKGQKQGEIKGSVIQKGREGKIMIIAVNHEIASPRDVATGMATGKRQHKPFTITKQIDKSSPLLFSALVNNETITDWELQFFTSQVKATAGAGVEVNHYTIKLTNAHVIDIKTIMPNNKNPELAIYTEYEELQFNYQKIEWTWTEGGVTFSDTWTSQPT